MKVSSTVILPSISQKRLHESQNPAEAYSNSKSTHLGRNITLDTEESIHELNYTSLDKLGITLGEKEECASSPTPTSRKQVRVLC